MPLLLSKYHHCLCVCVVTIKFDSAREKRERKNTRHAYTWEVSGVVWIISLVTHKQGLVESGQVPMTSKCMRVSRGFRGLWLLTEWRLPRQPIPGHFTYRKDEIDEEERVFW